MKENAYERLDPFIKNYIYRNNWTELRGIQASACDVIFDTDDNLLLSSGTASGKTEAAFLPVLTQLKEKPSTSIGVLYISPLKALINDQFYRLEELLRYSDIPVHKWHGDVPQSKKAKVLLNPKGVLQTTPETLEGMLMHRKASILKLFSDLHYIIIDEVHYFMNSDRGIQLLCILERIQRLIGKKPRRIGLSATLGDYSSCEGWLNSGTDRQCNTPENRETNRLVRIGLNYYKYTKKRQENDEDEISNFIFRQTSGKRCIVFANSKSEVEETIGNLKQIAELKQKDDVYHVHHGSISASLREFTEKKMKITANPIVTGATVTLELGIDIGDLDLIVQIGSPHTVSSFVQRLGRSGRRGNPSQIQFVFEGNDQAAKKDFYEVIDWQLIKCIAIIQLYLEDHWIEPIALKRYPYEILYHQIMSFMVSSGEVTTEHLVRYILTLKQFESIPKKDFEQILEHLVSTDQLQKTERNQLLMGLKAERDVNNYRFYAVFEAPQEYSVRCLGQSIGSVQEPYPTGTRFALAGKTWEVKDLNIESKIIYVNPINGKSANMWRSLQNGKVHTRILKKMKEIISGKNEYKYLNQNAKKELCSIRDMVSKMSIDSELAIPLSENSYALFPWVGTGGLLALSYALKLKGINNTVYNDYTLIAQTDKGINRLKEILVSIKNDSIDKYAFDIDPELIVPKKFSEFIPKELQVKQFIEDFIDVEDLQKNLFI